MAPYLVLIGSQYKLYEPFLLELEQARRETEIFKIKSSSVSRVSQSVNQYFGPQSSD